MFPPPSSADKYKDGSDVKGDFCSSLYRQKDIIERRELKKRDYRVYQKSCNKLSMYMHVIACHYMKCMYIYMLHGV